MGTNGVCLSAPLAELGALVVTVIFLNKYKDFYHYGSKAKLSKIVKC